MRVSIFKNILAEKPQETELDKIVAIMQHSNVLCKRTQTYRENFLWGRTKKLAKSQKKTLFPAFTPSAILKNGKSEQYVCGLTGLCFLDIDHIEDKEKREEIMQKLREDEHVVLASRSVSDEGLHVLIKYQLKDMEALPDKESMTISEMKRLYELVFCHLAIVFFLKFGREVDSYLSYMGYKFLISYDADLYYNPDAEPVVIDLKFQLEMKEALPSMNFLKRCQERANYNLSKGRLEEAEKVIQDCLNLYDAISRYSNWDSTRAYTFKIPAIESLQNEISVIKDRISKVDEILAEAKVSLQEKKILETKERIDECYKILKRKGASPGDKILVAKRKQVNEFEREMAAVNKVIKGKKEELYRQAKAEEEYRNDMLEIIGNLEEMEKAYQNGDMEKCYPLYENICYKLSYMPKDENTNIIKAQIDKWEDVL